MTALRSTGIAHDPLPLLSLPVCHMRSGADTPTSASPFLITVATARLVWSIRGPANELPLDAPQLREPATR